MNAREQGIYPKYSVNRLDGSDQPGGRHHGDEYFVLDLTTDKFSVPALNAYADACELEYPLLASDLRAKIGAKLNAADLFIQVPETTLPNGLVVPAFAVGQYGCSRGVDGRAIVSDAAAPWVKINFDEARAACDKAGYQRITESQCLALAHDIVNQDINWTGGKVGEGDVFMGLHKGSVDAAQPGSYEPTDPAERRWHQLSNGARIYDFAGNAYTWVVDDVQGDDNGLTGAIKADSPSLTTAPFPSMEKGMGWRPDGARNWSGNALLRGGFWYSGSYAGVFRLDGDWPDSRYDYVGFRCTKPGL